MTRSRNTRRIVAMLLTLFMLASMLPTTAATSLPNRETLYKYDSRVSSNGFQVEYGMQPRNGDKPHTKASLLQFKNSAGNSETLQAWSANLPFDESKQAHYSAIDLKDLLGDNSLTTAQLNRIRAILHATSVQFPTNEGLKAELRYKRYTNSNTPLNDNARQAGIQTAIWRVLHNDGTIKDAGNGEKALAAALARYLLDLPGLTGPESATPVQASLVMDPIDVGSYNYTTPHVDVVVNYTIGTGATQSDMKLNGVPDGVVVKERVKKSIGLATWYDYTTVNLNKLIADGKEHTLVLFKVSDETALNLSISGTQDLGYSLFGLITPAAFSAGAQGASTQGQGGTLNQLVILNSLFKQIRDVTATAQMDLSTARGTLVIKKSLDNTTAKTGSFSLEAKGPFGFAKTETVGGNSAFVYEKVRYGSYSLKEKGTVSGFIVMDDDDCGTVTAANATLQLAVRNWKLGSITVEKNVTWSEGDTTAFPIKLQKDVSIFGDPFWVDVPNSYATVSEMGSHVYTNLAPGKYKVVERLSKLPEGYRPVKSEDIVTIGKDGSDVTALLENEKIVTEIDIEKTATRRGKVITSVMPEETITYKVVVSNTGNVPLTGLAFQDSLVAALGTVPAALAVGESVTFTYDYLVPSAKFGLLENTISVSTTEQATDSATAMVNVKEDTDLDVTKNAPPVVLAGEIITYGMDLFNNGNTDITGLKYTDLLTGRVNRSLDGLLLQPDASETGIDLGSIQAPRFVEWVVNRVDVSGRWFEPLPVAPAMMGTPADVDGDDGSGEDDGSDGGDGIIGSDGTDGSDGLDGSDGSDGSDGTDGSDGSDVGDGSDDNNEGSDGDDAPPQDLTVDTLKTFGSNNAEAAGRPVWNIVLANDTALTRVLQPDISIQKEVSEKYVLEDEIITYSFRVKNRGTAPLRDILISDPVLRTALGDTYNEADFTIEALAPGKTVEKHFDVSVAALMNMGAEATAIDADTVEVACEDELGYNPVTRIISNKASVTGTAWRDGSDFTVTVSDTSELVKVKVLKPAITISKFIMDVNPDEDGSDDDGSDDNGSDENDGSDEYGSDDLHASGELPGDGELQGAGGLESFGWHKPGKGDKPVKKPVLPSGSELVDAYVGDTVRFGIIVTNTGEEVSYKNGHKTAKKGYDLTNLTLSDPLLGGETWNIASLKVGESFILTDLDYVVDAADEATLAVLPDTIINTATVTGFPNLSESDDARIHVMKPAIDLTKEANVSRILRGNSVEYTFTIRNTGNVALNSVTVVDELLGGTILENVSLAAAGDADGLDTHTFTKTYQTSVAGVLRNTATVTASTLDGKKQVEDTATVDVTVFVQTSSGTANTVFVAPEPVVEPAEEPVVLEEVPDALIPEGPVVAVDPQPVVTETPDASTGDIALTEAVVPAGPPELPKTGGLPLALLFGLGGVLSAAGLFMKRKQK